MAKKEIQVAPVVLPGSPVIAEVAKLSASYMPAGTALCNACSKTIALVKVTYPNGRETILPSHGRCERCQTIHLCNVRMDKLLTSFKHLAAMAPRLTPEERQICLDVAIDGFNSKVVPALSATFETKAKVRTGFNLAAMGKH